MKDYKRIIEMDVLRMILSCTDNCYNSCGIVSPSNIASLLKTSRYQVNKYIKVLKNKNLIQYAIVLIDPEYDALPYQGYKLTEQGRLLLNKERSIYVL